MMSFLFSNGPALALCAVRHGAGGTVLPQEADAMHCAQIRPRHAASLRLTGRSGILDTCEWAVQTTGSANEALPSRPHRRPNAASRAATQRRRDIVISIERVGHVFRTKGRRVQALLETDLRISEREFLTIVGPSGCGKSTLMNLIVGLFPASTGEILYRGKRHSGVNRSIGYVTQADNLYPWRTLRKNIEFPLELRGVPARERRERSQHLIQRVGLAGFEDSYPHELSGGMRQRANIVRTLAYEPEVILMDEPFGPLDAQTRLILQNQLLELWQEERKTIIFITHDLGEAVALADRVVVMSARPGRIKTDRAGADSAPAQLVRNSHRRAVPRNLSHAVAEPGGRGQEGSRAVASTDLNAAAPRRYPRALPMSRTTSGRGRPRSGAKNGS